MTATEFVSDQLKFAKQGAENLARQGGYKWTNWRKGNAGRHCPICGGTLILGEEHLHIGQIRADSTSWTGRHHRPAWQRVSISFWAKVYVWARYRLISGFCRATGGHHWDFMTYRCEGCGLGHEWIEDWGDRPKLSQFLRVHAVVI